MENPAREIEGVIKRLCTGGPSDQQGALSEYFTEDASFIHPFCYVPPFAKGFVPLWRNVSSLYFVRAIFTWYKIISPSIDISIESAAFDKYNMLLYVTIHQTVHFWFIPFHRAPVKLVTVLKLRPAGKKYLIEKQEDMYQFNDCIQFICPGIGPAVWTVWQLFSTLFCFVLSVVFLPLYYLLNKDKTE